MEKSKSVLRSDISNVRDNHVLMPSKGRYWNQTGKYQEESDALMKRMEEWYAKTTATAPINWHDEANSYWTLLNGMSGIYYGYYNDGDDAAGAIDNNRVHGFQDADRFAEFCLEQGAVEAAKYVRNTGRVLSTVNMDEALLERAMDEVIKKGKGP
jgi:hypothetical protein